MNETVKRMRRMLKETDASLDQKLLVEALKADAKKKKAAEEGKKDGSAGRDVKTTRNQVSPGGGDIDVEQGASKS